MSEVALLSFGCAISFIVVAATYIYAREGFTRTAERDSVALRRVDDAERESRRAA